MSIIYFYGRDAYIFRSDILLATFSSSFIVVFNPFMDKFGNNGMIMEGEFLEIKHQELTFLTMFFFANTTRKITQN